MVKRRSIIVSLVMVLGVCPVCQAAAVCILSVLPTHGNLQYIGINTYRAMYADILGLRLDCRNNFNANVNCLIRR